MMCDQSIRVLQEVPRKPLRGLSIKIPSIKRWGLPTNIGVSWKTLIEGSHVIYFVIARFSTATFTVFVFITVVVILTITHVNVANHSRQKLDFESSLLVIT